MPKRIIPLIDAEFDKGYSPAEIEQIVHDIVAGQLSYRKLKYAVDLRKAKKFLFKLTMLGLYGIV